MNQSQRVVVPDAITMKPNEPTKLSVSLNHAVPEGKEVTLEWRIENGTADGDGNQAALDGQTSGTLTFAAGETSKTLELTYDSDERWNGTRTFVVEFDKVQGALFDNEAAGAHTTVYVNNQYTYTLRI